MSNRIHVTVKPPSGRPCWVSQGDLPLRYLGWGTRDFRAFPVSRHCDVGTTFYLVSKGELTILANDQPRVIAAPQVCLIDKECFFGISSGGSATVEILVWVWRDPPRLHGLRPDPGGVRLVPLDSSALPRLAELHRRCRDEAERGDAASVPALSALQTLVEVEIERGGRAPRTATDGQWAHVKAWIDANLSIHAPVPALCDYLNVSPSTLNRFFTRHAGMAPGEYFREAKRREALRLINNEGWPVKTTAFHLGYRHATDLSRALGSAARKTAS